MMEPNETAQQEIDRLSEALAANHAAMTNNPPSTDAPPQEPSLCDLIKEQIEATTNQSTYAALVWAHDKAMTFEQQAAALRLRLETIEAALTGVIAFARLWVGYSPTPFEVLNAVDAAELALKPEQPALCGDREGECVCNLPKSHDGNHEDRVEGQETVGWENVPAPRRRW